MTELLKKAKTQVYIFSAHPLFKKYSIFLIPIISLLSALLIVFLLTIPQSYKIVETNNQINVLKEKQQEYQTKIIMLETVDLTDYKTKLENVLYTLPSEKDIPGAIASILQLLSTTGLKLDNISLGTGNTDKNTSYFLVKLDVSGNRDQLKTLVTLSDEAPRIIKVNGISLNNSSQNSTQATVDILIFYAALEENIKTSADQKITLLNDKEKELLAKIEQNIQSIKEASSPSFSETPSGKEDPFN